MRTRLVRQQCKNRLSFPSHGYGDGDDACRGGQEDPASKIGNLKQYGELPETARINETAVDMAMEGDDANDDIGIDFDEI